MNKYLVIGNPIEHSLSPLLHNFWFKKHGLLNFIYDKKKIEKNELKKIVEQIQKDEIKGVNITVPFKRDIFNYIDLASEVAQSTNSINTLVKENNKIIGHNTDQEGFKLSLKDINWNFKNKKIFIIGAGGVTSSILSSFINIHGVDKIYLCNRTRSKAEDLKNFWDKKIDDSKMNKNTIEIIEWGKKSELCDLVINTTSVGLKKNENISFDFSDYKNKREVIFYDLIYNPRETNFLKNAKIRGNKTMNGKMMFLWQAQIAFKMWTGVSPEINKEVIELLN